MESDEGRVFRGFRGELGWAHSCGAAFSTLIGDRAGAHLGTMTIFPHGRGRLVDKKLRPRKSDPYLAERGHFVSCIVEDKERLTTADQMIGLQKALDAIVESAETGEWVTTG